MRLQSAGHTARTAGHIGLARAAADGGPAEAYAGALKRWRIANLAQSVLYLALLVLMVFHWRL